jgi:hypothetical protein
VRPLTPYNEEGPAVRGHIGFLDASRKTLPLEGPSVHTSNVLMSHDWTRCEMSVTAPDRAAFAKVNLNLGNAVGTVYFDTVSLVTSTFKKVASPEWLADAIVYSAGPWEYARYRNGRGFVGLKQKLPEIRDLGVNMLYLLPVWETAGGKALPLTTRSSAPTARKTI